MRIRFAISLLNYELRNCWEISSIVEQRGPDLPEIIIDVAILKGTQNPYRYPVALVNEQNPKVRLEYWPTLRGTFARRGLVRNKQLKRALKAGDDWIFFADADRTYHPEFFSGLAKELGGRLRETEKCVSSRLRISTDRESTIAFINQFRDAGPYHPKAYLRSLKIPREWTWDYAVATGGMQVCRPEVIKRKLGNYCPPNKCPDRNLFRQGQYARSDVLFRQRMGGSVTVKLPAFIHLNHDRDKTAGKHLETQR